MGASDMEVKIRIILLIVLCGMLLNAQNYNPTIRRALITTESKGIIAYAQSEMPFSDSIAINTIQGVGRIDSIKTLFDGISGVVYDSLLSFGTNLKVYYTGDRSTIGTYNDGIIIWSSSVTSPDTILVSYSVVSSYELLVQDNIIFGQKTSYSNYTLRLTNNSTADITINSMTGLSAPFYVLTSVSEVSSETVEDILIAFQTTVADTYLDSLFISHSGAEGIDTVIISGEWVNNPVLVSNWITADPGGGGWYRSVRVDKNSPNYVYTVGDLGGFSVSDDYGATWVKSNSGMINYEGSSIAVHPDTAGYLLVGTDGGFFKSTDYGDTFTRLGGGQVYSATPSVVSAYTDNESVSICAVAYHPKTARYQFAGGGGFAHGVRQQKSSDFDDVCSAYYSHDYGVTWNLSTGYPTTNNIISSFSGSSTDSNIVYMSSQDGLYKSTNGGASYFKITIPLDKDKIRWVAVNPSDDSEVWYTRAFDDCHMYKSTTTPTALTGTNIWSKVGDNLANYVTDGSQGEGIEGKITYTPTDGEPDLEEIRFSATGDTVYVGVHYSNTNSYDFNGIIYWSNNGGTSWNRFAVAQNGGWITDSRAATATSFDLSPNKQYIYYTGSGGVDRSIDYGVTASQAFSIQLANGYWQSTGGLGILVTSDIIFNPIDATKVITATRDNAGQYSVDGGLSWKKLGSNLTYLKQGECVEYDPSGTIVYMFAEGSTNQTPKHLFRSLNDGATWSEVTTDLPDGDWSELLILNTGTTSTRTMYALSEYAYLYNGDYLEEGVWKSTNSGANWTKLKTLKWATDLDVDANGNIWVASSENGSGALWKYNGSTWTAYQQGNFITMGAVICSPSDANIILVAENSSSGLGKGIYRTANGGTSWTKVLTPNDPFTIAEMKIDPNDGSKMYAIMYGGFRVPNHVSDGIYYSDDAGLTWTDISSDLPYKNITSMDISNLGEVIVGTPGGGSFKLNTTETQIVAPTITLVENAPDYSSTNTVITATVSTGGSSNLIVKAMVNTDTLTWTEDLELLTYDNGVYTKTFSGLNTEQAYKYKVYASNEAGSDTSIAGTFTLAVGISDIDTFYVTQNYDDVLKVYNTQIRSYSYLNLGLESSGYYDIATIFSGIEDFTTIDSAKIGFYHYNPTETDEINYRVYGLDVASPLIFQLNNYTDFNARVLTTAYDSAMSYTESWSLNSWVYFDVTNSARELMNSYSYSAGRMGFKFVNQEEDNGVARKRAVYGYDFDTNQYAPRLIIWGTK